MRSERSDRAAEHQRSRLAALDLAVGEVAASGAQLRFFVFVEGTSDRNSIEALAARFQRRLSAEGTAVVAMGGATNFSYFLSKALKHQPNPGLAGLCDEGEVGAFHRGLERVDTSPNLSAAVVDRVGLFVCVPDLEAELIRAAGFALVESVIEAEGEGESLRRLRSQPAWRTRPPDEQLRRFMGSRSGRKARYARQLVAAMDLERTPRPLRMLLEFVE